MTFKEVYDIAVPAAKRKKERWNLFAGQIGRPISVLMTLPFIGTKITPSQVTLWSLICAIIGAVLVSLNINLTWSLVGWGFFFLWNLLDGVDGNLARATNQCSPMGELWDATGGYAAMILTYFSAGVAAYYDSNIIEFCDKEVLLIIGGLASIFSVFPRLIMQKKKTLNIGEDSIKKVANKESFGLSQIIAMNFISVSGFLQVIFLLCIVFHTLNFFVAFYLLANTLIMIKSLHELLK